MGFMDAFTPEDRIQIKMSDLFTLMQASAKAELFMNAAVNHVPHEYIIAIMNGKSDELKGYRDTGLKPEDIEEVKGLADRYKSACEESVALKAEIDRLREVIEKTEKSEESDHTTWEAPENDND